MDIVNTMRTKKGDTAMREAGIDPDKNPATAVLAGITPPEAKYLTRVLPPTKRGCDFPGRFDKEDSIRYTGWGPAPGEEKCDYPGGCEHIGSAKMRCPIEVQ